LLTLLVMARNSAACSEDDMETQSQLTLLDLIEAVAEVTDSEAACA
jgi:hypothetical protein